MRFQGRFDRGAVLALAVFLLALLIRIPGIGWGLKNDLHYASYHPDEPVIFGYSRQIVPGAGRFTPGNYSYGTLYLTLLRIASDVTTTYSGEPDNTADSYWSWVSRCNLAGRILNVIFGAATALLVCFIGRRALGEAAGVVAGCVMAVAPGLVMHSRFQTVDVLATLLLSASLLLAVRIAQAPEDVGWRDPVWCGVLAGLSAGTKYTGILAILALACALWVRRPKGWPHLLGLGILASILAFVVATPGAVLDSSRFLDGFWGEMLHTSTGHGLVFAGTPSGFLYHLMNLGIGIDGILVILGLAGIAWAAYRRHAWAIVLLSFWIPYYILIGRAEVKFLRYTFPLYPAIAVGVGYAVVAAHRRGSWARIAVGAGIFGFGGVGGGGLRSTALITQNMLGEDPRNAAARSLRATAQRVGLVEDPWFWSPPLFPDSADPGLPLRLKAMAQSKPPEDVVLGTDGMPSPWDPKLISDLRPDSIAFSSFEAYPVFRLKAANGLSGPDQYIVDQSKSLLSLLTAQYDPDGVFGNPPRSWFPLELMPEDFLYAQPVVWTFKRK